MSVVSLLVPFLVSQFGVPPAAGVDGPVHALVAADAGVVVAGSFDVASGVVANNVALWDGASWRALGTGTDGPVHALYVDGSSLYAGGSFGVAGGVTARNVARWDGSEWSEVGDGVTGPSGVVKAIAADATGLLVAGVFAQVGASTPANGLARWTGFGWEVLGGIVPGIEHDLRAVLPLAGRIYVGGVLRFPGSTRPDEATLARATLLVLSDHAGSANTGAECTGCGSVDALATSGTDLYAAGRFTALGQVAALGSPYAVVRLADATIPLGLGEGTMSPRVQHGGAVLALLATADGLIAGGNFVEMRGVAAGYLARWDGADWSSPAGGVSGPVRALAVRDGSLFAGGDFVTAGGVVVNHVARWDGVAWTPLTNLTTPVRPASWGAIKNTYR